MNSNNNSLQKQITELQKDNICVQRSLTRIESTVMDIRSILVRRSRSNSQLRPSSVSQNQPTSSTEVKPSVENIPAVAGRSRRRELLQNIANRPVPTNICWYHRQFGAAANPKNCLPGCKFEGKIVGKPMISINHPQKKTIPVPQPNLLNVAVAPSFPEVPPTEPVMQNRQPELIQATDQSNPEAMDDLDDLINLSESE